MQTAIIPITAPHLRVLPRPADQPTMTPDPFVRVPPAVLADTSLSERARLLYCLLTMHHNPTNGCFPTRRLLAGELGCSLPALDRAIKELDDKKLIERTHPKAGGLTYYVLPLITGDKGGLSPATTPLITGDESPLSPVITRTRLRELDQRTSSSASGQATYVATLDGAFDRLVPKFEAVSPQLTRSWIVVALTHAESQIGPLSKQQLGKGLTGALDATKTALASGRITNPRAFARKQIVTYLQEQRG